MAERHLDAAVVMGPVAGNPTMRYMVNGARLTSAIVVKRRGRAPVLVHGSMERDEASLSGLDTIDMSRYRFLDLLKEAGGDRLTATVQLMAHIFDDLGVKGRVGFYGIGERGATFALLEAIGHGLPEIQVVGEFENDIFTVARATKDSTEVARIRSVAERTVATVDATRAFLAGHKVRNGVLIRENGQPLRVRDVKAFVRRVLCEQGLEEEVELIFAIGRDAGIPHSHGRDEDLIQLGKPIVFDLFPRERSGGYFFDMTRTWCLGFAPPEVQAVYDDVRACFEVVLNALEPGGLAGHYHHLACEFFEARGHPTVNSDPGTETGFVHSLGHGIGLSLHERPHLSSAPGNEDRLEPGVVFAVEPGLYYPDRGLGVRLEDVLYLDEAGVFHNLTNYSLELLIEVEGSQL